MKPYLTLLLLLSQPIGAQTLRSPEAVTLAVQAEMTQSQNRQPAYALLAEQQPEFLARWRTQLRQQIIVMPKKQWSSASDAIALSEALNIANRYLARADDASVDAYFQQQRLFLDQALTDAGLCSRLLNTATSRADSVYSSPWLMDGQYRKSLPALQRAVTDLIVNAQNQPERTLPAEQNQLFLQRLVTRMAARFGQESLTEYDLVDNENAAPSIRCKAVWQVAETIQEQAPELRAHLVRVYFGR
jgi:hypothetical protein